MKRLLSPIIDLLPDWVIEPFQRKSFIVLSAFSAYISGVSAHILPWLNILTMMVIGWVLICLMAIYEQRLRNKADKNLSELKDKFRFYTLLVVLVAFLFVLTKMLDAWSGTIVGSGVVMFFGIMFLGDVAKCRRNWKAKYKPLADLSSLDRLFEAIEKKWIPNSCKIEPIDEDEEENSVD